MQIYLHSEEVEIAVHLNAERNLRLSLRRRQKHGVILKVRCW
jgi:hypothetical protein